MRKLTFYVILSSVLLVAFTVVSSSLMNAVIKKSEKPAEKTEVLGKEIKSENTLDLMLNENDYQVSWFRANPQDLRLIPNFEGKNVANDIFVKNNCKDAINAGFYDENDKPLGLFIADSKILHNFKTNKIMNAILSINRLDTPRITREVPQDPLVTAVQTGPLLIENDSELAVTITTDKPARRSVAAITGNNELYFLIIYLKNSSFSGPFMYQLPEILTEFEKQLGINIADAINLDGGSASFFRSGEQILTELSPIGALFCVQ